LGLEWMSVYFISRGPLGGHLLVNVCRSSVEQTEKETGTGRRP